MDATPTDSWLQVENSRGFVEWMARQNISLGFTTYQANKLFLLGRNAEMKLSIVERTFPRCMGLWGDGQSLWMSSLSQVWRFENVLAAGTSYLDYDKLYIPRVAYTTGDLDIHDLAVDQNGALIMTNTKYSCLATLHHRDNFVPLWRPRFISRLAAEDRCHLNGLAMEDGKPRFASAFGQTDSVEGWRENVQHSGCVLDISSGDVVAAELSMPHSPRLFDGKLWVLNSGTGELGHVDLSKKSFIPRTFCPGYLRGLAFHGHYALAGLSRPRSEGAFKNLPLQIELDRRNVRARCGLVVIDMRSGDIVQWLWMTGDITELYDVVVLPGVSRPATMGFKTDELQNLISIGER